MTTQPMPSAKLAPGHYEVLGTSRHCEVVAVTGYQWALVVDGERHSTYPTKRDALVYCQLDVTL